MSPHESNDHLHKNSVQRLPHQTMERRDTQPPDPGPVQHGPLIWQTPKIPGHFDCPATLSDTRTRRKLPQPISPMQLRPPIFLGHALTNCQLWDIDRAALQGNGPATWDHLRQTNPLLLNSFINKTQIVKHTRNRNFKEAI